MSALGSMHTCSYPTVCRISGLLYFRVFRDLMPMISLSSCSMSWQLASSAPDFCTRQGSASGGYHGMYAARLTLLSRKQCGSG